MGGSRSLCIALEPASWYIRLRPSCLAWADDACGGMPTSRGPCAHASGWHPLPQWWRRRRSTPVRSQAAFSFLSSSLPCRAIRPFLASLPPFSLEPRPAYRPFLVLRASQTAFRMSPARPSDPLSTQYIRLCALAGRGLVLVPVCRSGRPSMDRCHGSGRGGGEPPLARVHATNKKWAGRYLLHPKPPAPTGFHSRPPPPPLMGPSSQSSPSLTNSVLDPIPCPPHESTDDDERKKGVSNTALPSLSNSQVDPSLLL